MRFYFLIANKFLSSNRGVGRFTGIISKLGIAVGSFSLVISISVLNWINNSKTIIIKK